MELPYITTTALYKLVEALKEGDNTLIPIQDELLELNRGAEADLLSRIQIMQDFYAYGGNKKYRTPLYWLQFNHPDSCFCGVSYSRITEKELISRDLYQIVRCIIYGAAIDDEKVYIPIAIGNHFPKNNKF